MGKGNKGNVWILGVIILLLIMASYAGLFSVVRGSSYSVGDVEVSVPLVTDLPGLDSMQISLPGVVHKWDVVANYRYSGWYASRLSIDGDTVVVTSRRAPSPADYEDKSFNWISYVTDYNELISKYGRGTHTATAEIWVDDDVYNYNDEDTTGWCDGRAEIRRPVRDYMYIFYVGGKDCEWKGRLYGDGYYHPQGTLGGLLSGEEQVNWFMDNVEQLKDSDHIYKVSSVSFIVTPISDRDGDGILDVEDECVDTFGDKRDGCQSLWFKIRGLIFRIWNWTT